MARVVRSTGGTSLGVWVQVSRLRGSSTAWYVVPLDPRTGHAGEALEIDAAAFAATPPPCPVDADGWLLEGRLPIEPHLGFSERLENVRASGAEARVIADVSGALCVDGLAAVADSPIPALPQRALAADSSGWARGRPSVPLALRVGAVGTRRLGLRCAP
jgi:hypothetical protein